MKAYVGYVSVFGRVGLYDSTNDKKGKGNPYSITKRRVPELIPVLGQVT